MQYVYSSSPWLIPRDPGPVAALFARGGRPCTFRARHVFNFGEQPRTYLIERGLVGTYARNPEGAPVLIALFSPGTILGAEKSLKEEHLRVKPLQARVLLPVRALALDSAQFTRELAESPGLLELALRAFLSHDDSKIEGLLINGTLDLPARLALMIATLFTALGQPLDGEPRPLPRQITVTELARLVHSSRPVLSRVLSRWACEKLIEGTPGAYLYDRRLLGSASAQPLQGKEELSA
ncbi:MAG: Crp/Fnr family transcriptional regulator [Mesosutterella sp.]|nr:Crp/Fnr family transcriptional regulator [Mesosutterella sp.]